jgi:hypothetical protein
MNSKTKKRAIAILTVIAAISVGVAAYAYWSNTGSGTVNATTANDNANPVKAVVTSDLTGLYPGGRVDIAGKFDNTGNHNNVHVNAIHFTVASVQQKAGATGPCTTADYAVETDPGVDGTGVVFGDAVDGSFSGGVLRMKETGANQDGCKGATVTLGYSIS